MSLARWLLLRGWLIESLARDHEWTDSIAVASEANSYHEGEHFCVHTATETTHMGDWTAEKVAGVRHRRRADLLQRGADNPHAQRLGLRGATS